MTDDRIWNEKTGVRRTVRENILLYLFQEGEVEENELRNEIYITRKEANQHLEYLVDNDYINKSYGNGLMKAQYSLSEKGDNLVAEIRWEGDTE